MNQETDGGEKKIWKETHFPGKKGSIYLTSSFPFDPPIASRKGLSSEKETEKRAPYKNTIQSQAKWPQQTCNFRFSYRMMKTFCITVFCFLKNKCIFKL